MSKQLHMFEQPQNLSANLILNCFEKSSTHNSHDVFNYNTMFFDPNYFILPIDFAFVGPVFYLSLEGTCPI
jgi:hypothetical protein